MDPAQQPTPKQQVIEAVRSGESIVITTSRNPGRDEIAAAIGLHLLLVKLDKVAEVVIAGAIPKQLDFLPTQFINDKLQGQRDFIVEVDQSRTEADHLKYVTEDGKLKIYITPYNGIYTDNDVSFSYGDYHCDVIVGLGAHDPSQLDPVVTKEQKLIDKARFVFINAGTGDGGELSWSDPAASSLCEMVMSMSEALGSGMMDKEIATALFTGIVEKTEHFTNPATTPKVMTMAAQLLAAGANQAEVVKRLSAPMPSPKTELPPAPSTDTAGAASSQAGEEASAPANPPEAPSNEFQIRHTKAQEAPTSAPTPPQEAPTPPPPPPAPTPPPPPPTPPPAPPPPPPAPNPPPPPPANETIGAPLQRSAQPPPAAPPSSPTEEPAAAPSLGMEIDSYTMPREKVLQPPSHQDTPAPAAPPSSPPSAPPQPPPQTPSSPSSESSDLEAARRAVEEAHRNDPPAPQLPPSA